MRIDLHSKLALVFCKYDRYGAGHASLDPRPNGPHRRDPVVVSELTKTYPGPVEAVRGLSFRVRAGEIFGLLGPNGAGKTTTVGVLTTLVRPTSGQAAVGGHDVRTDPVEVRRSIGVVFQDSVLDNDFSGAQNLRLHARLWRVPDAERRIASLLAAVGLTERADDVVWTYSGGMRRRLEIARALLADPKVMFLDEPTLGLDPIARRDLWQVVRTLRERHGVTIVLSTHYLEEAQDVCDRVAIVDQGLHRRRGQAVRAGRPARQRGRRPRPRRRPRRHRSCSPRSTFRPGHIIQGGSGVSIVSAEPRQQLTDRISALPLVRARRDDDDRPSRHAQRRLPAPHRERARARPRRGGREPGMSAAAGFVPLYQRRVAIAVKTPVALVGQALMPILWVLVVGPALARAGAGSNDPDVDYYSYVAIGQIVFILPFSAMFAGLTVLNDRNVGVLRELLVAPIRRATIPLASIAAVLTVAAGQIALIVVLSAHPRRALPPRRRADARRARRRRAARRRHLRAGRVPRLHAQATADLRHPDPRDRRHAVPAVRRALPDRHAPRRRAPVLLDPAVVARRRPAARRLHRLGLLPPRPDLAHALADRDGPPQPRRARRLRRADGRAAMRAFRRATLA